MSDRLFPMPIQHLLSYTLHELDHKDSFFGIPAELFYNPADTTKQKMLQSHVFNQSLHTPLGVAAGPHSQMTQNIIAAWLLGARYMELKTVQTLDELDVPKPCIDMQDEGYNCEWSQELKIKQSFEEYLNAWIMIHILNHRFGREKDPGVIFNMSVGYNLEGILKENVQWFFDKMSNCSKELKKKKKLLKPIYPLIDDVDIPSKISDNITLSTMHGCPAGEIESIGEYLIEKKNLHTYIKLNPTLLGPEILRGILNDRLGFATRVPDEAFEHDLQYNDALVIIKNLEEKAAGKSLEFGLKLTNTLESSNHKDFFHEDVDSMYMSGRALHPLAVTLAHKLQTAFDGRLNLSFSGGADAFNISALLACGFKTVTTCTDLLKPGGMMRLPQYLTNIQKELTELGAPHIGALPVTVAEEEVSKKGTKEALQHNLQNYATWVLENPAYRVESFLPPNIKTDRELNTFDCISAPCRDTCATNQDIPEYMLHTSRGEFREAHGVILRTNPFPAVTGMICDHLCQNKCTRVHYDDALLIREVKRFNSLQEEPSLNPAPSNGLRISVIGAGPAGLSCAYFLALAGCKVHVYEAASKAGGMVYYAIPGFRLTPEAMEKDLSRITGLGVNIHFNQRVDQEMYDKIKAESDYVFAGTGAPLATPLSIDGIDSAGVLDPLHFLFDVRNEKPAGTGKHVVIIGGGNTAMDAARTAFRLVGEEGTVSIVYRRTIREMPADQGEIKAAYEEGVQFMELCAPEKVLSEDGKVTGIRCSRMELKGKDSSGRPKPVKISGSEFDIRCDTVIPAVGQIVETGFMDAEKLETPDGSYLTRVDNVYTGGDAMRGASTAINAIGDGRKAAEEILKNAGKTYQIPKPIKPDVPDYREIMIKRATRGFAPEIEELPLDERKNFKLVETPLGKEDIVKEAERCLQCDEVCNTCVTVCPNLANQAFLTEPTTIPLQKAIRQGNGEATIVDDGQVEIKQPVQILNIGDFCNECGNCETFCPTNDAPYKVKPKVHFSMHSFYDHKKGYYLSKLKDKYNLICKDNGHLVNFSEREDHFVYETPEATLTLDKDNFQIREAVFSDATCKEIRLKQAATMRIILTGMKDITKALP